MRRSPASRGGAVEHTALLRLAVWALVPAAAVAAVASLASLSVEASLARGRERLLAGDAAAAEASLRPARRWPPARGRADAGLALALALQGGPSGTRPPPVDLAAFEPAGLVEAALGRGDLGAALTLADLMRAAGHPLGALYGAVTRFERGDEAEARALADASPVPLRVRGLGAELLRALQAHAAGAIELVRDRRGALVGTLDASGVFRLADGVDALLLPPLFLRSPAQERSSLPASTTVPAAIRLTLDLDLSRIALQAIGSHRGSIVLVEPRTGSIVVAVSDAKTAALEGWAPFTQRREPASIAKVLTAAAAYRAGIDADRAIAAMTCAGVERYGGRPLWCVASAGPLGGLDRALAVSCNVAFANLAMRVGREALAAELRLWGFDAGSGALLGAAGRIRRAPRTDHDLAQLAVGLELVEITPLHAALVAAVMGNDGRMAEPRLIAGRCGPLGLTDRPVPIAPPRPVVDPRVSARLRQAMEAVARDGTGAGLTPDRFPTAMKTGTAAEPHRGYHVNYIGLVPVPDATIAFCVRITDEPSSARVTEAGREATTRLLAALAERAPALARAAERQRAAVVAPGPAAGPR